MLTISANVMTVKETSGEKVITPIDAARLCKDMENMAQEMFVVIDLNTKNTVIDRRIVTLGVVDQSLVHAREVFRGAIANGATSVIVAHNHPSGDATPSAQDVVATKQLIEAGKIIGIPVVDHIIVGSSGHYSIRESGLIGAW